MRSRERSTMSSFLVRAMAFGLLLPLTQLATADGPAAIDAYGRLPTLEDVALSPDGTRLAFVKTIDDKRLLSVVSLTERKLLGVLGVGEVKLRRLEWADDDDILVIPKRFTQCTREHAR